MGAKFNTYHIQFFREKNIKTELNFHDEINNLFKRIRMSRQVYHTYNPDCFYRAFTDTFIQ